MYTHEDKWMKHIQAQSQNDFNTKLNSRQSSALKKDGQIWGDT